MKINNSNCSVTVKFTNESYTYGSKIINELHKRFNECDKEKFKFVNTNVADLEIVISTYNDIDPTLIGKKRLLIVSDCYNKYQKVSERLKKILKKHLKKNYKIVGWNYPDVMITIKQYEEDISLSYSDLKKIFSNNILHSIFEYVYE